MTNSVRGSFSSAGHCFLLTFLKTLHVFRFTCFPLSLLSFWCIFKYSLTQIHCQRTLRNVLVDSGTNRALDPPHSGLIPSECESQSWTPSPPLWKASSQPASLLLPREAPRARLPPLLTGVLFVGSNLPGDFRYVISDKKLRLSTAGLTQVPWVPLLGSCASQAASLGTKLSHRCPHVTEAKPQSSFRSSPENPTLRDDQFEE